MKKFFTLFLVLLLSFSVLPACSFQTLKETFCNHKWEEHVVSYPTCQQEGITKYKCPFCDGERLTYVAKCWHKAGTGGLCVYCQKPVGLQLTFSPNADRQSYAVSHATAYNLNEVIVPESHAGFPVTAVLEYGFKNAQITAIRLPPSVKTIGESAFQGSEILEATVSNGTTFIGANAFKDCLELLTVDLPSSLKTIAAGAFSGCKGLMEVRFHGTEAEFMKIDIRDGNDVFKDKVFYLG